MEQAKLNEIIEAHRKWLASDGKEGSRADLTYADLMGANLAHADLTRADLTDAWLPTGEKWEQYLAEVVPAFLTAGGKALSDVATAEHWDCHDWNNCPAAVAFSCDGLYGVPVLLRPRAAQFIQFFDAGLIPLEAITGEKVGA